MKLTQAYVSQWAMASLTVAMIVAEDVAKVYGTVILPLLTGHRRDIRASKIA